MQTIQVVLPEDIIAALESEAKAKGVSLDAVASIFLCHEVTHTLIAKKFSA